MKLPGQKLSTESLLQGLTETCSKFHPATQIKSPGKSLVSEPSEPLVTICFKPENKPNPLRDRTGGSQILQVLLPLCCCQTPQDLVRTAQRAVNTKFCSCFQTCGRFKVRKLIVFFFSAHFWDFKTK